MRCTTLFTSVLLLATPFAASSHDFAGWATNTEGFEETLEKAERNNDPFIVYFHTERCGWCSKLEAEYLKKEPVKAVLSDMLKVHIDVKAEGKERALASKFKVQGYPTFLIVFPTDNLDRYKLSPFRQGGAMSPQTFAEQIEKAADALEEKHVGRSVGPRPSKPTGPPQKATAKDVSNNNLNEFLLLNAKLKVLEEYEDSLWLKLEDPSGTTWAVLRSKGFYPYQARQEYPLEVDAMVTVAGLVKRDKSTRDVVLDARDIGKVSWGQREPSQGELLALQTPIIGVEQLKDARPGRWVPLAGTVLSVEEEKDPKGLWIELGTPSAKAGLWLDGPVVQRMNWKPAPGDQVEAVGILLKEEDALLGSLDIVTPLHIRKAK